MFSYQHILFTITHSVRSCSSDLTDEHQVNNLEEAAETMADTDTADTMAAPAFKHQRAVMVTTQEIEGTAGWEYLDRNLDELLA